MNESESLSLLQIIQRMARLWQKTDRLNRCLLQLMIALVGMSLIIARPSEGAPSTTYNTNETVFLIGRPDGSALEFGLSDRLWPHYLEQYPKPIVFEAGRSQLSEWPYIHPSHHDKWAGGKAHTFRIRFKLERRPAVPQYLIIGLADAHTPSQVEISLNGAVIATQKAPKGAGAAADPTNPGQPSTMIFPLPPNGLQLGMNELGITLSNGSWIIYDYLYLGASSKPLPMKQPENDNLREEFLAGPLANVEEIVFAVRRVGSDGHWYANIGYYSDCEQEYPLHPSAFTHKGRRVAYRLGGKLGKLNIKSGKVTWLVDDSQGGVRDPVVHYDGRTILFSWRQNDSEHYHLFTIQADGSGLKRLTDGDYDDFEPCWLPDGGIVFVSTRAKRWVNCWVTQVATLHRCDANGGNIQMLSANNEHDNTPWVLPDGRILYQRWEYVDRSQVDYHHLWTANPDGTRQMVFFGNQHPGIVMIDAKPIPGTQKVLSIFSPGHGMAEHTGAVVIVDPSGGPDRMGMAQYINRKAEFRDPWPFSENAFLVATGAEIRLMNGKGQTAVLYRLEPELAKAGYLIHEPRPLQAHPRERIIPPAVDVHQPTGRLILANVYEGRNMVGVKPGEIKKLLVLETLPKPVNFTGGMDPLTYGGSFTLERVVGTVPVEPDGSAYVELPAGRGLFFVALDENDMAVKRMQSFLTVRPGEVTSCVGCHEQRAQSYIPSKPLMALKHPPTVIEPIGDCPDVFDFPRDIQPILDRLCVDCHDYTATPRGGPYAGKIILSGDHGPMFSHSYFTMTVKRLFSDGRNLPRSNYRPREIGSSASKILQMLDGSHYGVRASEHDKKMLRLWIETGAPYPGTYAALGAGSIGGYQENQQVHTDFNWPATKAMAETLDRRCASCHQDNKRLPHALSDELGISFWRFDLRDPRLQFSRHIMFNLSRPDKSLLLMAPLSRNAGGFGICTTQDGKPVFTSADDPDYLKILAHAVAGKDYLEKIKRFDMPGYIPRPAYVREMKRYGVLPESLAQNEPFDYYKADQAYWRLFWPQPAQHQF